MTIDKKFEKFKEEHASLFKSFNINSNVVGIVFSTDAPRDLEYEEFKDKIRILLEKLDKKFEEMDLDEDEMTNIGIDVLSQYMLKVCNKFARTKTKHKSQYFLKRKEREDKRIQRDKKRLELEERKVEALEKMAEIKKLNWYK